MSGVITVRLGKHLHECPKFWLKFIQHIAAGPRKHETNSDIIRNRLKEYNAVYDGKSAKFRNKTDYYAFTRKFV
jgi:hypothetical protein